MESGEMLKPSSEFLFTPFSLDDDVLPLQDCVISVSQFADVKREHLMHLIEILGRSLQMACLINCEAIYLNLKVYL